MPKEKAEKKFIIGIDEAGRGPLAGAVAVGICKISNNFDYSIFGNFKNGQLKDSKKLSEKKREEIFAQIKQIKKQKQSKNFLDFHVALISEKIIDKEGISKAIKIGIARCLKNISAKNKDTIKLDGGIKAPSEFIFQETIIKGDEKIPAISLASICAKVMRDEYMRALSKTHPEYGFEIHKGYGTEKHRKIINKIGLCKIHRKTFHCG